MAKDAQSDFTARPAMYRERVMTPAITGFSGNDVAWHGLTATGRYEMIKFVGYIGTQFELGQVTYCIDTQGMGGVDIVANRQYCTELVSVGTDAEFCIGSTGVGGCLDRRVACNRAGLNPGGLGYI